MPVPLQRRDETRQDGFQTLPAKAIGSFPEYDERLADRLGIDPPGQAGWLVNHRINSGEQSNGMLAMTASDGNEFIQDCCFLELGCLLITLTKNFEKFVFRLLADLRAHAAPPEVGNIPVRQQLILGNNIDESTRLGTWVTLGVVAPLLVVATTPPADLVSRYWSWQAVAQGSFDMGGINDLNLVSNVPTEISLRHLMYCLGTGGPGPAPRVSVPTCDPDRAGPPVRDRVARPHHAGCRVLLGELLRNVVHLPPTLRCGDPGVASGLCSCCRTTVGRDCALYSRWRGWPSSQR